jgi:hypothetical protein
MKIEIVKIEKGDIILVQGEWVTNAQTYSKHIKECLNNKEDANCWVLPLDSEASITILRKSY